MQLNQLIYFTEVVNAKSISKAAQKLHVSQPSLSTTIKNMEEELGQPLFKRTKYGVIPTTFGLTVYNDFIEFKKKMDCWYSPKNTLSSCSNGSIHLSVMPSASQYFWENIIFPFNEQYSNIKFYLYNTFPQTLLSDLENGQTNIAVLSLPTYIEEQMLNFIAQKGWHYKHIFTDERVLCISCDHPLAQKDRLSLKDLKQLSLVYYSVQGDVISKEYEKYFDSSYRVASYNDVFHFIRLNKAVFLPCNELSQFENYRQQGIFKIFSIPVTDISNQVPIYAVSTDTLSTCEQFFYDYLLNFWAEKTSSSHKE